MKVLAFSDTHLTHKFKKEKFDQMYKLLNQDWDKIIINGDFWDSYSTTFDRFINSKWARLFPLLKDKAIYIYGNHDPEEKSDERRDAFSSVSGNEFLVKSPTQNYLFTHGHKLFETADVKYKIFKNPVTNFIVMKYFEKGVLKYGNEFFNKRFYKNGNRLQAEFLKTLPKNTTLVCGHTHLFDVETHPNYLNTGFIDFGIVDYIELDL